MKSLNPSFLLFTLILTIVGFAESSFSRSYSDFEHLKGCFASWGTHPFNKNQPDYRIVSGNVNVMGSPKTNCVQ
jgi:hypothetical protein